MLAASSEEPVCKKEMQTYEVARNKTLVGGLEAGSFKFLGRVGYVWLNFNYSKNQL